MRLFIVFFTLALSLQGASFEAQAQSAVTEFRELGCNVRISRLVANDPADPRYVNFESRPRAEIPESAFDYTLGMQTFWHDLTSVYRDPITGQIHQIDITVAMDKIGRPSKLSYVRIIDRNPETEVERQIGPLIMGYEGFAGYIGALDEMTDVRVRCNLIRGFFIDHAAPLLSRGYGSLDGGAARLAISCHNGLRNELLNHPQLE